MSRAIRRNVAGFVVIVLEFVLQLLLIIFTTPYGVAL